MTHYLVDLKQQFADHENHLGMVDQILDTLVHHQAAPSPDGLGPRSGGRQGSRALTVRSG